MQYIIILCQSALRHIPNFVKFLENERLSYLSWYFTHSASGEGRKLTTKCTYTLIIIGIIGGADFFFQIQLKIGHTELCQRRLMFVQGTRG